MHKSSIGLARGRFGLALVARRFNQPPPREHPPTPPLICRISSISLYHSHSDSHSFIQIAAQVTQKHLGNEMFVLSPDFPSTPPPLFFFLSFLRPFLAAPLNTLLDSFCACPLVVVVSVTLITYHYPRSHLSSSIAMSWTLAHNINWLRPCGPFPFP